LLDKSSRSGMAAVQISETMEVIKLSLDDIAEQAH